MKHPGNGPLYVVAVAFMAYCTVVHATQRLTVEQTDRCDVGTLCLEFRLEDNGKPLAGEYLYVTTAAGESSESRLLTGPDGTAQLELTSERADDWVVTARSRAGTSARYASTFTESMTERSGSTIPMPPIGPVVEVSHPGFLKFLAPPEGIKVETGVWQTIELKLTVASDMELAGQSIQVSMARGTVSNSSPRMDARGIARFMVKSDSAGYAQVAAVKWGLDAALNINFEHPKTLGSPYDGRFVMNSASRPVTLEIQPDKIGFLLTNRIPTEKLNKMAKKLGLSVGKPLGRKLYVFVAPTKLSQNARWNLTRELKGLSPGNVRGSGLVARMGGRSKSVVITETIYVKFKPPLIEISEVQGRLKAFPNVEVSKREYGTNEFILRIDPDSLLDPLEFSNRLAARTDVVFAHPDIIQVLEHRQNSNSCVDPQPWCDVRYRDQWNLENTGKWALEDADADVREAWDFTTGDHSTLIAIIDTSFDITHPDLEPNLWKGPYPGRPDESRRGIDLADGVHSDLLFDYVVDANQRYETDVAEFIFAHGTRVAGVAAAFGGNNIMGEGGGVAGACPHCKLLPVRVSKEDFSSTVYKAFAQASDEGANVISMSLGVGLTDESLVGKINEAVDDGIVVVIAMDNKVRDNCIQFPDMSSLKSVIAVSSVTDEDKRSKYADGRGHGDCMDVLAPSSGGQQRISTASVKLHESNGVSSEFTDQFGGSSAATPLVAGVAAMMKNVAAVETTPGTNDGSTSLTPLQIQRTLQDTADKVEPGLAAYDTESGFSNPCGIETSTHGYGRINAFEAVQLVAPVNNGERRGGKGNKDLLLRDHTLDWGNTEQPSNTLYSSPQREQLEVKFLQSVDIKIDVEPFRSSSNSSNDLWHFQSLPGEEPVSGKASLIYVRVRNRGHNTISESQLKLHWAVYENSLPDLSPDFWDKFPEDSSNSSSKWHSLELKPVIELAYSGASVAGCPDRVVPVCIGGENTPYDQAQVIVFEAPPTITWDANNQRLAWLAVIDSKEDHVQAKLDPPGIPTPISVISNVVLDNNVTLWTTGVPVTESVEGVQ